MASPVLRRQAASFICHALWCRGHLSGLAAAGAARAALALARVVVGPYRIRGKRPLALESCVDHSDRWRRGGLARISPALPASALPALDQQFDRRSDLGYLAPAEFLAAELPPLWAAIFGFHGDDAGLLSIVYVVLPQHSWQLGDRRDLSCLAQPFFACWRGAVKAVLAQGCGLYCGSIGCKQCHAHKAEVELRFSARRLTTH